MRIVGIDYSLNSPAICIAEQKDNIEIKDCTFHYLSSVKKYQGKVAKKITGWEYPKYYSDNIQRFSLIGDWVLGLIKDRHTRVYIEGYSYGSRGQGLFQIAENCGILKYKFFNEHWINYSSIVPSVVKKRATGKGNASKEQMYEQFMKDGGEDLVSQLGMNKLSNPVTDIVDSYYIMRTGNEDWYCN